MRDGSSKDTRANVLIARDTIIVGAIKDERNVTSSRHILDIPVKGSRSSL